MTKVITPSKAYSEVLSSVEKIQNDDHATIATMSPGDVLRQGDLYIIALDVPIPGGKPHRSRQLAPGNTQGSRHVAEGNCQIQTVDEDQAVSAINRLVPSTKRQRLFIGPMIIAVDHVRIAHPEHGDRTLPGDAAYIVTYQRTWANEIRRTQD